MMDSLFIYLFRHSGFFLKQLAICVISILPTGLIKAVLRSKYFSNEITPVPKQNKTIVTGRVSGVCKVSSVSYRRYFICLVVREKKGRHILVYSKNANGLLVVKASKRVV